LSFELADRLLELEIEFYSFRGLDDFDFSGFECSSELSESINEPMRNPHAIHSYSEYTQFLHTV